MGRPASSTLNYNAKEQAHIQKKIGGILSLLQNALIRFFFAIKLQLPRIRYISVLEAVKCFFLIYGLLLQAKKSAVLLNRINFLNN